MQATTSTTSIFSEKQDVFDVQRRVVDEPRHFGRKFRMNTEQKSIYDTVCNAIRSQEQGGENVERLRMFVSGSAGVGKSFLIDLIANELTIQYGRNVFEIQPAVVIAASTGIAALAIKGQTVHSLFSIPIGAFEPLSEEELSKKRAAFVNVRLVIIDEISMMPNCTLAKIHARLCEIRGRTDLFGGLNVILVGDLLQLRPVDKPWIFEHWTVQDLTRNAELARLLNTSADYWRTFKPSELTINMRHRGDLHFSEIMSRVRVGKANELDKKTLNSRRQLPSHSNSIEEFLALEERDPSAMALFATRMEVQLFNEGMTKRKCKKVMYIRAVDEDMNEADVTEMLARKRTPIKAKLDVGLPDVLVIGEGARIMITWSVDPKNFLVNRASGTVESIEMDSKKMATALIVRFDKSKEELTKIERKSVVYKSNGRTMKRWQFPVAVAFGSTIHKAQGLTMTTVMLHTDSIFGKGQFFVGASRVTALSGLHLVGKKSIDRILHPDTLAIAEYDRLRILLGRPPIEIESDDSFDDEF